MDREALVRRNQEMAERWHGPAVMHRLRDYCLYGMSKLPVRQQGGDHKRVLVIRPDHVGDVLLTTPAIQLLKRRQPEIDIHVLCGAASAEVLSNYSEIDLVLTLPFPGFERGAGAKTNPYLLALRSARMLRRIGYGSAVIMRPDHWWGAYLAFLAGIRERIGYDIANVKPFLSSAVEHRHQHAVLQNTKLVERWTGEVARDDIQLDFPVGADEVGFVEGNLADWGIGAKRAILCIHPGSGASSKIWAAEKWAAVADAVSSRYDAAVVFTGTAGETALIKEIESKMKADSYSIAGSTSIGQLAALYQRSLAVLGPDSGAMHLAAAVGGPTVALFGPADPVEFAPWGDRRRHAVVTASIGCRPCRILDWGDDKSEYHPCVRDITVDQVLGATERVLLAEA